MELFRHTELNIQQDNPPGKQDNHKGKGALYGGSCLQQHDKGDYIKKAEVPCFDP